jgi:LacI family transcriptional regulator
MIRGAVTRDDVARHAGTSTAVVSYVVNGGPRAVAPSTRARVLAAIDALGYRPNRIAQALSARRSGVLGLILPDSSNPFFAGLAREVERATAQRGYMLLLANAGQDPALELRHVEAFLERKVDGIFLISANNAGSSAQVLVDSGVPHMLLDRLSRDQRALVVRVDNEMGGAIATRHLIGFGHRRIGHLAGPGLLTGARERAEGYRRAMREAGLAPLPELMCAFDLAHAFATGRALLSGPDRPTALFVSSDVQALGVLRAAADLGVDVPGGLSVVGFDGIPESAYSIPRLTTVAQPVEEMAVFAAELLIDGIERGATKFASGRVHTIPPVLIERESCAPPRTAAHPRGDA